VKTLASVYQVDHDQQRLYAVTLGAKNKNAVKIRNQSKPLG
jgi:hypothetical protein